MNSNLLFQQPINNILVTGATVLTVSLDNVKNYLKIPTSFTQEDALLTSIINSSTTFFERITGRDLITKTYKTYLDNFPVSNNTYKLVGCTPISLSYKDNGIIIKKSKLQTILSIQYYSNGVLTTWGETNYYFSDNSDYSGIYIVKDKLFPEIDERKQSVVIEFTAGYGVADIDIPNDIIMALLQMIAYLYDNRGDCEGSNGIPTMAELSQGLIKSVQVI